MNDSQNYGFAKLVPGFDFLQTLAKGGTEALPQMPSLSSWVAPTLNVEELDKRIQELRAVHFWLEQNSKALGATIQALEVQKMTLATLKGMNYSMADLAQALKLKPEASAAASKTQTDAPKAAAPGGVDPMAWWGSLTQQFQHIAASALQDAAQAGAAAAAEVTAAGKGARKRASAPAKSPRKSAPRRPPARPK